MLWKLSAASFLTIALSGCQATGSSAINDRVCTVWRPITWSGKDTAQTITEVKANNARRGGYCK